MLDLAPGATLTHRSMRDSFLLAGRFAATTRLSPKALRLYAEQGLLTPAHIDPSTGYRYYTVGQLPRARMIARLRLLGLPVARVGQLVEMSPAERAVQLRCWLTAQNERLAEQTELVETMVRQDLGDVAALTSAIATRARLATKIIYRQQNIAIEALDSFMAQAEADARAHLKANDLSADGPMSVLFRDIVTHESEALVEVAVAYEGSVEPAGDLRLRLQPARREIFLPVPAAYEDFPLVLRVYDALETWLDAHGDLACTDSPFETYPGTGGARFDVAYPIA